MQSVNGAQGLINECFSAIILMPMEISGTNWES